jgi:antitoxin HicB
MRYPALFEPAPQGGFVVTFPNFAWGITQGDGEAEALEMAADALVTMLQESIRNGEELPRPSRPRGRRYRIIELPALVSMKAELYLAFRASGLRKAELARRMGIPKTVVDRLFDLTHNTRMEQIEAAFTVLDKRLEISVKDAA